MARFWTHIFGFWFCDDFRNILTILEIKKSFGMLRETKMIMRMEMRNEMKINGGFLLSKFLQMGCLKCQGDGCNFRRNQLIKF